MNQTQYPIFVLFYKMFHLQVCCFPKVPMHTQYSCDYLEFANMNQTQYPIFWLFHHMIHLKVCFFPNISMHKSNTCDLRGFANMNQTQYPIFWLFHRLIHLQVCCLHLIVIWKAYLSRHSFPWFQNHRLVVNLLEKFLVESAKKLNLRLNSKYHKL